METGNHGATAIAIVGKAVNAGFKSSWPGQKPPTKGTRDEPSSLNKILDQVCQIHSTPSKPANYTHRECWVLKQSDKLNTVHKGEDTPSEDEDEPPKQDTGEQKKFPPEVKTVNVLHMIKGKNNAAPPGKYTQVPVTAKSCQWSSQLIIFDHHDYSASIRHA